MSGDGSNSYLSKGKFSTSIGSLSVVSNHTTGWASLGGWEIHKSITSL